MAVTLDTNGYYEVPYDRINDLKLLPPKNSNVDFDLTIKGVVKDTAILTDASGQTHTVVNEKETGSQSLHVDLVGVVDEPHFDLNTTDWTQDGNGYSITIQEDGRAPLDFKLTSGEWTDTPLDHSETLNLVLEGLPEGARVFDGNGKELTLNLRRARWQGQSPLPGGCDQPRQPADPAAPQQHRRSAPGRTRGGDRERRRSQELRRAPHHQGGAGHRRHRLCQDQPWPGGSVHRPRLAA
ncbi:hypothetical protein ACB290_09945 [Aeromonas caviae]